MTFFRFSAALVAAAIVGGLPAPAQQADGPDNPFNLKPGFAETSPGPEAETTAGVTPSLVAESDAVAPGGTVAIGLKLVHGEGWHTYYANPGIGKPTTIRWDLPEGWSASEIQWPTPEVLPFGGFTTYGYEGEVLLITEITAPDDAVVGTAVTLGAEVEWLGCKVECIEGDASLSLSLTVDENPAPQPAAGQDFAEARAHLPVAGGPWSAAASGGGRAPLTLTITPLEPGLPAPEPGSVHFIPSGSGLIDDDAPQTLEVREGDPPTYVLSIPVPEDADKLARVTGLLRAEGGWTDGGSPGMVVDVPVSEAGPAGAGSGAVSRALPSILAFAFLGGLILNLMPCVFPVIGIKILGFVNQSGEAPRKVTLHGLVFTLGVLVSFWFLSGLLLALRAGGGDLIWGFQLQEPLFVYFLIILFLVFSLNLLGVFELGASAPGVGAKYMMKSGFTGSFFSGVLAVIVATPCSAPFLATALGAVLALPAFSSLVVFTAMGLGLALPYLVLSAFPSLVRYLPRPGAWMETFKQFIAFPLLATAGYLVWVYAGQVEDDNVLRDALIGLALVGLACWTYGRWVVPGHTKTSPRKRAAATAAAVITLAVAIAMGYPRGSGLAWEPWSPSRVAELRAEGRPVYIDFTARWCVTCQSNKLAYSSDRVVEAIRAYDIALLKADHTNDDPAITRALAQYGESAIPVNVLYIPGRDAPIILPKILTPDNVLAAFEQIGQNTSPAVAGSLSQR